jgi:hypothetical protein
MTCGGLGSVESFVVSSELLVMNGLIKRLIYITSTLLSLISSSPPACRGVGVCVGAVARVPIYACTHDVRELCARAQMRTCTSGQGLRAGGEDILDEVVPNGGLLGDGWRVIG